MRKPIASTGLVTLLVAAALWAAPRPPSSAASRSDQGQGASKGAASAVVYTCPMHPDVASARPGKCPKCGMFLEAKPMDITYYTCPMHPDVKSDKPGRCPECGMNLEKRTEQAAFIYTCPMHPEVKSEKPGKCPKCGMFLEARPTTPEAPKGSADHRG